MREQPDYLNAAVSGRTNLDSRNLLSYILDQEKQAGRDRQYQPVNGPRQLDIDIILFGSMHFISNDLEVPHPRFRDRRFVLEPAAEIASNMIDPVTQLSIGELLARCVDDSAVARIEYQEIKL